jgi:hypothetical protein
LNFLVLVYSGLDSNLASAILKLGNLTADGIEDFAAIDSQLFDNSLVDPKASIHCDGSVEHVHLLHWLAHNKSNLNNLRVVGVAGGNNSLEALDSIDNAIKRIVAVVKTMSGHLIIEQFRISLPTYSSSVPRGNFFSSVAKANLVVIPRDSATHNSIARPIEQDGSDDMASHIALELSAIFGMWKEMETSPADDFAKQNDIQDIRVQFVSSRVSLLECPALPIHAVMSLDGELPLPHQFLSVPDTDHATERFAQLIYPIELRFEKTQPPLGHLVSIEGKKLKSIYLKELLRAFTQTPKALFRGVQDYLEQMGGEALQEAVGGAKSSIEVIYPGSSLHSDELVITSKQIDELIAEIGERNDRPLVSTIEEQSWTQMVEKVISIADGGPAASEVRTAYSNDRYLLTRQSALSPETQDLEILLRDLHDGLLDYEVTSVSETTIEPSENAASEVTEETIGTDLSQDRVPETPESLPEELNALIETGTSIELCEVQNPEASLETESRQGVDTKSVQKNVLSRITQIMNQESRVARNRAVEMVNTLRILPSEFSASEVSTISNAVKLAVAAGLSVVYFVIGALTGRRNWFNFEFLGDKNQSLAWTLMTTLLVFAAVSGLLIRSNEKWQGKVIAASTALVVLLGLEFVLWNSIWTLVMKVRQFRGGPIAATILLLGAIAVVAVSITRNRMSESRIRKQFAGMLFVISWIYVVVGVTAAAGSDRSVFWSEGKLLSNVWAESRSGIRNVGLLAGFTLLIVSGLVVAFTIVRERYKLEELSRKLVWATSELESSIDAEKRLRLAAVQWTGTAAVIARLFRFPLGSNIADSSEQVSNNYKELKILKFDQQRLDLTRKGEQGLTARVRQLFVARNWLGRQYRQLLSRFQEDLAFEQGLDRREAAAIRPETCPSVPSFDEVLSGHARGPRWTFMRNVFSGIYDDALLETTSELQLEAAYSTIVDDPDSHSVGDTQLIAPQFFERLIPENGPLLPSGLVTKLFTGSDQQQIMNTYVWWPDELLARPRASQHANFKVSSVLAPERVTDPIRLLGTCVLVSVPFLLDEVSEVGNGA